jgi:hypothetical protein
MTHGDGAPEGAPVRRRRRRPHAFHFGLGDALARSFACFGKHLPVLCLFGLVLFLPLLLYSLHVGKSVFETFETSRLFRDTTFWEDVDSESGIWGGLLDIGLPLLLQATVTFGVFQYLSGARVDYGRSFGRGVARLLPVLGVAILTWLLAIAVMAVVGILLAVFISMAGSVASVILALLVALAVLFTILCIFFVAAQAVVVEGIGPLKAMSRSSWLTRGARWKVFAIVALVGAGTLLAEAIVQQAIGAQPSSWTQAQLGIILSTGFTAIFSVFGAVSAAVVYHDLRQAKEGVGLEDLIRVFD